VTRAALAAVVLLAGAASRAHAEAPVTPVISRPPPTSTGLSFPWAPPRIIEGWQPGQPIPPGYEVRHRSGRAAIGAGAALFGFSYTLSALSAWWIDALNANPDTASNDGMSHHALYIPVVGPLWESTRGGPSGPHWSADAKTDLVVDGLAQAAGLGLLAYGILARTPLLVRNDGAIVSMAPRVMGKNAAGLGLLGAF
jgi:hypothetical protein